jgi:GDP-L-fucose synthase
VADFIWQSLPTFNELPQDVNLGYGMDYTVLEYYQIIADYMGYKGKFVFSPSAPVGMSHKLMDISLAQKYGWKPKTELVEGLRETIKSYLTFKFT